MRILQQACPGLRLGGGLILLLCGMHHVNASPYAFITNQLDDNVAVIDTATQTSLTISRLVPDQPV